MDITFTITVVFIAAAALAGAFFSRIRRDKCLKNFNDQCVTLFETDKDHFTGRLHLESTGFEMIYSKPINNDHGIETSYILYKSMFKDILALARFHDQLDDKQKKIRDDLLQKTYHPNLFRRTKRKTLNLFKTIRDSFAEVINLLMNKAKKTASTGSILTSQDKYVSQMKQQMLETVAGAYEPLLERHIGQKVTIYILWAEKILKYNGILRDYTAEFVEMMDVDFTISDDTPSRKTDIIVPRNIGIVRHVAE